MDKIKKTDIRKSGHNRERILQSSVDLFNQSGVVAITTNHIAAHLKISPGNLYFHFRNKEQILVELFQRMSAENQALWNLESADMGPVQFVHQSFELYWKYRFFHREIYHLRRKDPELARLWHLHIRKSLHQLKGIYARWVKIGFLQKIDDPGQIRLISDTVLIAASWFLQFFESVEKPAHRRHLRAGVEHILRILAPHCKGATVGGIQDYLNLGGAGSVRGDMHA